MISDEDIQALVDDELSEKDAAHVRQFIHRHSWAEERYEELVEQKRLLKQWWLEKKDH